MAKKTKKVETIDLTPTWTGILPVLLAIYEFGDKSVAIAELRKMAGLADDYNDMVKTMGDAPLTSDR
jgi:hypothetical protein